MCIPPLPNDYTDTQYSNYIPEAAFQDFLKKLLGDKMIQSKISATLKKWALSPQDREGMDKYFLLYWDTQYFLTQASMGKIRREGIDYLILYPTTSFTALQDKPVVALSFRKLKSMSYGYVLVQPTKEIPGHKPRTHSGE